MLQTSNLLRQKLCLHAQDAKEDIEPKSVYNQRDGCDYQRIHPICMFIFVLCCPFKRTFSLVGTKNELFHEIV